MVLSKNILFGGWVFLAAVHIALAVSCFAAADMDNIASAFKFYLVWLGLTAIAYSVISLYFFGRALSAVTYGAIIGMTFIMAQLSLMSAVLAGRLASSLDSSSMRSVTAFSSLAFAGHFCYIFALMIFRDHVVGQLKQPQTPAPTTSNLPTANVPTQPPTVEHAGRISV